MWLAIGHGNRADKGCFPIFIYCEGGVVSFKILIYKNILLMRQTMNETPHFFISVFPIVFILKRFNTLSIFFFSESCFCSSGVKYLKSLSRIRDGTVSIHLLISPSFSQSNRFFVTFLGESWKKKKTIREFKTGKQFWSNTSEFHVSTKHVYTTRVVANLINNFRLSGDDCPPSRGAIYYYILLRNPQKNICPSLF